MGNKCTCFNENKDNKTCDLSNNMINETNKGSQFDLNSMTDQNQIKHTEINQTIKFLKYKPKTLTINPHQVTELNKYIKGYLYRKEYNKNIKQKLIENSNNLYSQFIKKYAQNEKVNQILYSNNPNISSLLSLTFLEFYKEDPIKETKEEISKIKKYPKGIIFKYPDSKLILNDINQCIINVESVYKGEVDIISNKKCGIGELIYRSGAQKYGNWYNNEFKGWNRFIDNNGILYIGLFMNNELNGKGIKFIYEKNQIYKGDFINE